MENPHDSELKMIRGLFKPNYLTLWMGKLKPYGLSQVPEPWEKRQSQDENHCFLTPRWVFFPIPTEASHPDQDFHLVEKSGEHQAKHLLQRLKCGEMTSVTRFPTSPDEGPQLTERGHEPAGPCGGQPMAERLHWPHLCEEFSLSF